MVVSVNQLGRQEEVSLQRACIDDIQDDIHILIIQIITDVQLVRTIFRQGVSAGQVNEVNSIRSVMEDTFFGVNGDAGVVADLLMETCSEVEERCFAAVGVPDQCDGDVVREFICLVVHMFL